MRFPARLTSSPTLPLTPAEAAEARIDVRAVESLLARRRG